MALAAGPCARLAAGLVVAALIAAPDAGAKPPAIRAPEAIAIDAGSGIVLYAKHPDGRRAIASTTKLMTALLALQSTRPTEVLAAVPYRATPAESRLGLAAGERMTVRDLMRALLLASANDAAATIAHGVAGSEDAFVARMNDEARRLHLTGTSYANPIGLDDPHNYSTPRDLAALARRLMRDRTFARIVDLPRARLTSGAHPRTILNRNELVGTVPFVDGVKTGHTMHAGYVLVGAGHRAGAQVISVVLGEPSEAARNSETVALLRYGLSRFRAVEALSSARTLALAPVKYFDGLKVRLHAARDVRLSVPRGARIETHTRLPFPLRQTGPIPAGRRVGSVSILVDGRRVARVPLVTASPVPGASFWRRAAIRAGATRPTLALGLVGVALLAAFQLRGLVLRRMRGRVEPE